MNNVSLPPDEALARRKRVLAPTYRLFYEEPLHVVRGEGVWLYDAEGRPYLDAYNNVPVVGHCHPKIVARLVKQASTLNTHTRYITDSPIELAERLLATMPRELTSVTFTCTGSESNDLAVRISKVATGRTGFIVTDSAYHGTSETLSRMSPVTGQALGPDVFTVAAPIGESNATEFSARVRQCIEKMRAAGIEPAALLVDTIFGSDGVAAHPVGFLAEAVKEIHAAGGLFIADEVQPGFGRTGLNMWGFQRHGVIPDLVTMGKPMGNGHPVAALVARPEVMNEFAETHRYFNTFGGNTVACEVGLAVLDVIEEERLMANAHQMGELLQQGLRSLASAHPLIGEVRGAGLFIGVQVESREATARIVNGLRRAGVLIGSAGRNVDVLKIRPPLTIARAEVEVLLEQLAKVLEGEARTPAGRR
jgi:4-aminobutyrate aminotransferase-like enzyme